MNTESKHKIQIFCDIHNIIKYIKNNNLENDQLLLNIYDDLGVMAEKISNDLEAKRDKNKCTHEKLSDY